MRKLLLGTKRRRIIALLAVALLTGAPAVALTMGDFPPVLRLIGGGFFVLYLYGLLIVSWAHDDLK